MDKSVSAEPSLRGVFGETIELDGGGIYRILAELSLGGNAYAVLQSDAMKKDGEIEVFRVTANAKGEPELETVEDDDEWESVAEAYDDLQFGGDERP
ncbi:DUF1292 domain-containing protein [Cohnella massiliensis]|uniref:DUF1292 domain-containing protein n=1 Tax=Cohnella massiliensis TaxID=1816691 RepID=UPI0009BA72E3|nr:DUF1292 domain-containing protein [Cohnella massiliensis]